MTGAQIGGIVRAILSAVGGYLVGQGLVDQATMEQLIGGFAVVATAGWSWWSKRS